MQGLRPSAKAGDSGTKVKGLTHPSATVDGLGSAAGVNGS